MRLLAVTCCALALAACQREAGEDSADIFAADENSEAQASFDLQEMLADDLAEHELEGELGCSFTAEPGGNPLLVARGFVADEEGRAQALVKYGGAVMQGQAIEPGGYDAIVEGATFDSGGMMLDVARISDEPAGRGESPPYPAMLRATEPIAGETIIEGFWACGP